MNTTVDVHNSGRVEVVLVNLPWQRDGRWGVRAGSRWPHLKSRGEEGYLPFPFFLAYAAAVLRERGIGVRIIDALADKSDVERCLAEIHHCAPRLLIAEVSTPSLENDMSILRRVDRRITRIAVCGLDATVRTPEFFAARDFLDYVMAGEYEYTARDVYEHLAGARDIRTIPGLMYRDGAGISVNPGRQLAEDIDQFPWPLRDQLPMEKYLDAPGALPVPSVQMLSSRGCPFTCTFCAWPQLMYGSPRYRVRRPELVVDEMEHLVRGGRFRSVYFDDDTFNASRAHVLGICDQIKKRKLRLPWAAMARADLMDEEVLYAMRDAGAHCIKYGLESSDQELLRQMGKAMDRAQAERMVRFTASLGIRVHLAFTFGAPGETEESVQKTIDYALSFEPESIQFSILTPYPGTAYYRDLEKRGLIVSREWADYDAGSRAVVHTGYLGPDDLEAAREKAVEAWRRYRRSKKTLITMPFDRELHAAFWNNLKANGLARTLAKTARYVRAT